MAKKIQISTIREVANVQVIRINASFVVNAVQKQITLEKAIDNMNFMIKAYDLGRDEAVTTTHNLLVEVLQFFRELENAFDKEDDESLPTAKPLTLEEAQMKVNYLLQTGKTPHEIVLMDNAGEDFGNLDVAAYLNDLENRR